MKNLIYIFLISFLFISCNKKEMIHVSAINPVTGAPYSGLRFTITEEKTGAFNENFKTVYDSHLNTNGESVFEFKIKKNRSYKLSLETPENNCYKEPANKTFAIQDESFDFKFELAPCAFYKKILNNINCQDNNDNIKFYYLGNQLSGYLNGTIGEISKEGYGCFYFESSNFSPISIGNHFFRWEVTRNGSTEIFYDTLYLEAGEYRTYEINY